MSELRVRHVLFYDYVEDVLERRGPYRAEHLALLARWKQAGRLVSAGALGNPPAGAMFVFAVDDPQQIDAYLASDPYLASGLVAGHRVVPWTVVV